MQHTEIEVYTKENIRQYCDVLAQKSQMVNAALVKYGFPALLMRNAGFESLVRLILEQQVSLASAMSVLQKLIHKVKQITPEHILSLTELDFKSCGFSKQKVKYVRNLANEILEKGLDLSELSGLPDDKVRERLTAVTGIGDWTCDCYLLINLRRMDIFPGGDLALRRSMKENGLVPEGATRAQIEHAASKFSPYRSVLSLILWHAYKQKRGISIR